MKRKTIDAMREVRLWICQVGVPLAGIAMTVPEVREGVVSKYKDIRSSVSKKFKK